MRSGADDPSEQMSCDSCGRTGDDLEQVGRVYVTIADDGTETVTEVAGTESWCPSCRATYPHVPA